MPSAPLNLPDPIAKDNAELIDPPTVWLANCATKSSMSEKEEAICGTL